MISVEVKVYWFPFRVTLTSPPPTFSRSTPILLLSVRVRLYFFVELSYFSSYVGASSLSVLEKLGTVACLDICCKIH